MKKHEKIIKALDAEAERLHCAWEQAPRCDRREEAIKADTAQLLVELARKAI